jgi:hypothetical protein
MVFVLTSEAAIAGLKAAAVTAVCTAIPTVSASRLIN